MEQAEDTGTKTTGDHGRTKRRTNDVPDTTNNSVGDGVDRTKRVVGHIGCRLVLISEQDSTDRCDSSGHSECVDLRLEH